MLDVDEFDVVFPKGIHYTQKQVDEIREFQSHLGGKTFFERLLEILQIKDRKNYPPKKLESLHKLHKTIVDAPIALHYKHCLFFYMLKDLGPAYHDQTELATAFAHGVHLEKRFWTFIEGLWALDHLQFETAVGQLTHPSIIPTFPDEIMVALLNRRNMPMEATNAEYILPAAYYNCAKPPLVNEEAKTEYVRYMADRSVTETFYWIRGRPEYEHKRLLEILIEEALERNTLAGKQNEKYSRQERATELVGLPFDEEEEKWLENFLTEGKGRNFSTAKDTVLMRRIATGRLVEMVEDKALKVRKMKHDHVNWEILQDGLKKGLGPRIDTGPSFTV